MKKAYILGVILIVAGILISQYPKGSNAKRYLVYCKRVN